jgi:hypothetical protein
LLVHGKRDWAVLEVFYRMFLKEACE